MGEQVLVYFAEDGDICRVYQDEDGKLVDDWSLEGIEALWPNSHGVYRVTFEKIAEYPGAD